MNEESNTRNPYAIEQPWVVSFSGGRTSAFMLWKILEANGGLPEGNVIAFANTGREHESTLDFVEACSQNWRVPIVWVERQFRQTPGFRIVTHASASRNGEPFAELIEQKQYLPNPIARFCTQELKVQAIASYLKSIGIMDATMAVGLRADEPRRVHRVHGDVRNGFSYVCPMHQAGHTLADVATFWKSQRFDLRLPNDDRAFGNCDLCFLKGRSMVERVMREEPQRADWWIEQEEKIKARFRKDRPTYAQMLHQIRIQPTLFERENDDDSTIPCTCTD